MMVTFTRFLHSKPFFCGCPLHSLCGFFKMDDCPGFSFIKVVSNVDYPVHRFDTSNQLRPDSNLLFGLVERVVMGTGSDDQMVDDQKRIRQIQLSDDAVSTVAACRPRQSYVGILHRIAHVKDCLGFRKPTRYCSGSFFPEGIPVKIWQACTRNCGGSY